MLLKIRRYQYKWAAFLLGAAFFCSCKSGYQLESFTAISAPSAPNYEQEQNWAVLPSKYPKSLLQFSPDSIARLKADVFYVYPTVFVDKKDARWNVALSDEQQKNSVINRAVKYQASAWASSGQLYVPFYRQAHLKSYSHLDLGGEAALNLAYQDIKAAFEVYLAKYNRGRPIIIASHSQGTTHTKRLLKEFFDSKPLQDRLIAAYLVGIRTKVDEFKSIKLMNAPSQTGGFVSWNTYKKGHYPKKDKDWYKGSVTSNPITWDRSKTSTLEQHKGFLFSNDKLYKEALKVQITDGLVWSTNPRFPWRFFLSFRRNYHIGDVNLFWQDIRENAELRMNSWFQRP